jgi:VWFA-related protein
MITQALAALALALVVFAAQVPQRPVFQSGAELVSIPTSVLEKRRPVTNLKKTDFLLTDNGVAQTLTDAYAESVPLDVTFVIDTSGSVEGASAEIARDLKKMSDQLVPADRIRVLTIDTDVHEDVRLQPVQSNLLAKVMVRGGFSSIHDALLVTLLQRPAQGRRAVAIVITDAHDSSSVIDAKELEAAAETPGPALHVVLVAPTELSPETKERARRQWIPYSDFSVEEIQRAASKTGGALHKTGLFRKDAVNFAIEVLKLFRQSYVLAYSPEGVSTGGRHVVVVTCPRYPEYEFVARQGYTGSVANVSSLAKPIR